MDEEQRKQQMVERYLRAQKKLVGHEEQKRRRAASAQRRQGRTDAKRRRHDFAEDDELLEGADTFEKIRRQRSTQPTAGHAHGLVDTAGLLQSVVTATQHGRVTLDNGEIARVAGHLMVDPSFRLAVGDEVFYTETDGPPRIEALARRRTCLSRPDPGNPHRVLVIAANVDIAVIVVAAKDPPLRAGLIDRLLLALAHGGVAPSICVNKIDLLTSGEERRQLERTMAPYAKLGCDVFQCSSATGAGVSELRRHLAGQTCVFVGHSGVGKSSILNSIDPEGTRSTGDVREHDGRGRHTTTASSLRTLADGTRVIDTPGVRAFGLEKLEPEQIRGGYSEFTPYARGCRFADCAHVQEPECAVRAAAENGQVAAERYASYLRILTDAES